jgi:HlyD family secretion protein
MSRNQLVPAGLSIPGAYTPPGTDLALAGKAPSTRGAVVLGMLAIILFIGSFSAWSFLAPLSAAAVAPGQIKAEGNRRTIQHLEGGIIREIMVRDGERVQAGQVLMRMDDIASNANFATLRDQRWQFLAQEARIISELRRLPAVQFPPDLMAASTTEPRAADAVASQQALFASRRGGIVNQGQMLELRLDQMAAQISSAQGQLSSQTAQLALLREDLKGRLELLRLGLQRRFEVLGLQRQEAAMIGNIEDLTAQIQRTEKQREEVRAQLRLLDDQTNNELGDQLRDVRAKLVEVEERLKPAQDAATRRDIVAPVAGTVLNLRHFTVGGVVRPGDPIMELTPAEDRLIADVQVQPNDIRHVHPGLLAEVRLPAFSARVLPSLHGHVDIVASDTLIDERSRMPYYRATIRIDAEQLAKYPEVELVPGMIVEAMIITGQRTFWDYLTKPLRDSFARAFREQ